MANLVLTVIGDDRAGLVDALSGVIAGNGGSWQRSQMARLAGKFAGIVLVTVADNQADGLIAALAPLGTEGVLDVTVERSADPELAAPGTAAGALTRLSLHLIGSDRPGIIHDISHALAGAQVSIEALDTLTREAPMAGGMLFEATATLLSPPSVQVSQLQEVLEALANELMVDLSLSEQ